MSLKTHSYLWNAIAIAVPSQSYARNHSKVEAVTGDPLWALVLLRPLCNHRFWGFTLPSLGFQNQMVEDDLSFTGVCLFANEYFYPCESSCTKINSVDEENHEAVSSMRCQLIPCCMLVCFFFLKVFKDNTKGKCIHTGIVVQIYIYIYVYAG